MWSGEDVTISGDNHNRHNDFKEFLFEVNPCVPDAESGKTCVEDAEAELAKMEMFVLYNTETFDKRDGSSEPVKRESVVEHFNFNPGKRYELDARVR